MFVALFLRKMLDCFFDLAMFGTGVFVCFFWRYMQIGLTIRWSNDQQRDTTKETKGKDTNGGIQIFRKMCTSSSNCHGFHTRQDVAVKLSRCRSPAAFEGQYNPSPKTKPTALFASSICFHLLCSFTGICFKRTVANLCFWFTIFNSSTMGVPNSQQLGHRSRQTTHLCTTQTGSPKMTSSGGRKRENKSYRETKPTPQAGHDLFTTFAAVKHHFSLQRHPLLLCHDK